MKGKAVITLCDAGTGREVKRIEQSNMFTNALSRLFKPPKSAMLYNWDFNSTLRGYLPLWKNILGGVMLLGNNVAEDADNFMLTNGIVPVGTAGDPYSGSCAHRGTLNENETYATENGYHFTWDFGTDKANGTIRCIGLTSRLFGNSGFGVNSEKDGTVLLNPVSVTSVTGTPTVQINSNMGYLLGSYLSNEYLFTQANGKKLTFYKIRGVDPSAILINDKVISPANAEPYFTKDITISISITEARRHFVNPDERMVYFFTASKDTDAGTTTVRYVRVGIDSLEQEEEGTVVLNDYAGNLKTAAIFGGRLYYSRSDGVGEYTMSGELVRLHNTTPNSESDFFVLDGSLVGLVYRNSEYYYRYYNCEGDVETRAARYNGVYCRDIPLPYMAMNSRNGLSSTVFVMALSNYMATILNLAQPLVKTNEQTLKISYDIMN